MGERKVVVPRSTADEQRFKIEKMMANPVRLPPAFVMYEASAIHLSSKAKVARVIYK
jgi:hypothetical protein